MLILDFQKIVDLIIHSIKQEFITEDLHIVSLERTKTKVVIGIDDYQENIQYRITIFHDLYDVNKAKISGFRVSVIHSDNWNEFSSFEAHALVDLEDGLRTILLDVVFFLADLEEVL